METILSLTTSVVEDSITNAQERTKALVDFLVHLDGLCDATGDLEDIEKATQMIQAAIDVTPVNHSSRIILYKHLADHLAEKSEYTEDVAFLTRSLQLLNEALALAPKDHQYIEAIRESTRARLDRRYRTTGTEEDLEDGIQFLSSDVHSGTKDAATKSKILFVLGTYFWERFRMRLVMTDLEEAIRLTCKALELSAKNSEKRKMLKDLGSLFYLKYQRTNNLVDLEEAISFAQKAADEPWSKLNRAGCLNTLAVVLRARYERTDCLADLERAISLTEEADANTLRGPYKPIYLGCLAKHLCARFERTGKMPDLERAIRTARTAADIAPMNHPQQKHPEQAEFFATLGFCLHLRYLEVEIMPDLDEAIQVMRSAVDITLPGAPAMASVLNSLSIYLSARYRRSNDQSDIEEAVKISLASVKAAPEGHLDRGPVLRTLGERLAELYDKMNDVKDLDEAIKVTRESSECSVNDLDKALAMNRLGQHLAGRSKMTGKIHDLDEAVSVAQNAVSKVPPGLQRALFLQNLAHHYKNRWREVPTTTDIDAAIKVAEEAIENTPIDHPERAQMWRTLGFMWENKFGRSHFAPDMQRAISCHKSAVEQSNARMVVRIDASTDVLRCCVEVSEWGQAFEALEIAVNLTPMLVSRSLRNSDKQHLLSQVVGLASDAAAIAFNASKTPCVALRLLEQGRGLLATSMEEMRADVAALRKEHPDMAEEFYHLQGELTLQSTHEKTGLPGDRQSTLHVRTSQPYQADRAFEQLLTNIRKIPEFEAFLLPPTIAELQAAATSGPIVVVNISAHRCDAILVERNRVRMLPLPDLSSTDIEEKSLRDDLGSPEVLIWLWNVVAEPTLTALGLDRCISSEDWPRLWWIPMGSLSKFPLHAAGRHEDGSGKTVLDRVMSSYGSSVKAIINSRRHSAPSANLGSSARALLVSMKHTPSYAPLKFADLEAKMVEDICKAIPLSTVTPGQLRKDIVTELPNCSIFHFAGHGHVDMANPSQSYLAVYDDTITVSALLEMNLRERSPFLAYLSACGTGQIKDDRFLDESIHLISACQLAGFRHVVGTLWEVNDELCVDMARIMYETVRDRGLNDDSIRMARDFNLTGTATVPDDVQIAREALYVAPPGHPDRAMRLDILAFHLGERYVRVGATADFEEAREHAQETVKLITPDDSNRAKYLHTLAVILVYGYQASGTIGDLEEAIRLTQDSVISASNVPGIHAKSLSHLALCYYHRFKHLHLVNDIDEAIRFARAAIDQHPAANHQVLRSHCNLADLLFHRYFFNKELTTLNEALSAGNRAIEGGPDDFDEQAGQRTLKQHSRQRRRHCTAPRMAMKKSQLGLLASELCTMNNFTDQEKFKI
ncbi:hypothetical protein KJ359_005931 [Pestalotiopsis sp. 9143b]|nr:hypothetical protein KJ359_005931 [Pestalotiopsis sp. 9143b]